MRRLGSRLGAPLVYLLLALLGHAEALADLGGRTQCACGDQPQTDWFLGWTPHALARGSDPFTTHALGVPDGVNLAWNTLLPLPGVLAAPVTAWLGPLASHTLLAVVAFAGSATVMWLVAGRWVARRWARFAAGLVYGFSPYLVAQGTGHLNLSLVLLPPVVLALLDQLLVRQDRRAARTGLLLGLATLAQLLITEEVLASTFVMCALGLLVLVALWPRAVTRARVRHAAVGLGVAAVVLGAGAAPVLAQQFAGPQRLSAAVQDSRPYAADLLGPVVPTVHQLVGTGASSGWGGNVAENGSYLGPLVLVLAVLAWRLRRVPVVRALSVLGVLAFVVSLGDRLHVAGTETGVWLPFRLLTHVPVLENLAAVRFSLYAVLCGALVLAVGLDRLRWRPAVALPVLGVSLVALLPAWPYDYRDARTPAYFTSSAVQRVPAGSVALTYPIARVKDSAPMAWQAQAHFRYASPGGYLITPDASGRGTFNGGRTELEDVFAAARAGRPAPLTPERLDRLRLQLGAWHVRSVLVATRWPGAADAAEVVTRVLGRGPDEVRGGVAAWYGVHEEP